MCRTARRSIYICSAVWIVRWTGHRCAAFNCVWYLGKSLQDLKVVASVFRTREWLIFLLLDHVEYALLATAQDRRQEGGLCQKAAAACESGLALVCWAFDRLFQTLPLPSCGASASGDAPAQDLQCLLYDLMGGAGLTTLFNAAGASCGALRMVCLYLPPVIGCALRGRLIVEFVLFSACCLSVGDRVFRSVVRCVAPTG